MKKFLHHVCKIVLPILFFYLVMEIAIRKIPNDYQLKNKYLNKNSTKINTLILGSSHTFYGLNPVYFSKNTFNAAYVSQTLDLDEAFLKKEIPNLKSLKTVIIPISYFSLFETLETDLEKWRIKNYVLYYGFKNKYQFTDNFEMLNMDIKFNIKKVVKYYLFHKSFITSSTLGWGTNFSSKVKKEFNGAFTAKKHTAKNFTLFNQNFISLQKIISICKKRSIKVVFVTTPTHKSYYKNLNKNQIENTINTITNLVQKNSNCIYYNLLNSEKFISEDFHDADHLNEIGAKKLSTFLNQKINFQ